MHILVLINGSERSIKVNVMREDHIIYIPQTMFSLFEAELSDPDGIKVVSDWSFMVRFNKEGPNSGPSLFSNQQAEFSRSHTEIK